METQKERQIIGAYHKVFKTPEGTEVLFDMAKAHHLFTSDFDENDRIHAFKSGERNVLLRIFKIINIGEHELSDMMTRMERGK